MEHEIASLNDPSNEKDIIKELSKTEGRIKNQKSNNLKHFMLTRFNYLWAKNSNMII